MALPANTLIEGFRVSILWLGPELFWADDQGLGAVNKWMMVTILGGWPQVPPNKRILVWGDHP